MTASPVDEVVGEPVEPGRAPRNRSVIGVIGRRRLGLLCLPPLVYMVVAFGYPLGLMISDSFTDSASPLSNYRGVITSSLYATLLWNTVRIALLVAVATLVVGYPYAYLMSRARGSRMIVLSAAILFPFLSSSVVRSFTWEVILEPNGIVDAALRGLGFSHPPVLIGNTASVVIGMTQISMPFLVLPVYAALVAVHTDYLSAAASLGANRFAAFRKITLPLSLPGVFVGCLFVLVYTMGSYVTPQLLGGNGTVMISQGIVLQVQNSLGFGVASTMGMLLILVTVVGLALAAKIGGARAVFRT
jgi:putative spermidine/putrescine transport system permease protein